MNVSITNDVISSCVKWYNKHFVFPCYGALIHTGNYVIKRSAEKLTPAINSELRDENEGQGDDGIDSIWRWECDDKYHFLSRARSVASPPVTPPPQSTAITGELRRRVIMWCAKLNVANSMTDCLYPGYIKKKVGKIQKRDKLQFVRVS